jgi:hypothetical protein
MALLNGRPLDERRIGERVLDWDTVVGRAGDSWISVGWAESAELGYGGVAGRETAGWARECWIEIR